MLFLFHAKQMELTDALKHYSEQKLGRLETMAPIEEAVVMFSINGHKRDTHKVEVTLRMDGAAFRAEVRTDDMYASLDEVADKLERKLRKLKEKIRRRLRRGGLDSLAEDTLPEEEPAVFEIGRVKRINLQPIEVEEAILELNMLDHNFYVFINSSTQSTEVVYKRYDGTYGLITS